MPNLLPPIPTGVPSDHSFWNDWYEKMRTIVNSVASSIPWSIITGIPTNVTNAQDSTQKNAANGYAGLNGVSRITKGVDSTDDVILDSTIKGLVLKSPNGHYWRSSISNAGVVTWTDLGTTKP